VPKLAFPGAGDAAEGKSATVFGGKPDRETKGQPQRHQERRWTARRGRRRSPPAARATDLSRYEDYPEETAVSKELPTVRNDQARPDRRFGSILVAMRCWHTKPKQKIVRPCGAPPRPGRFSLLRDLLKAQEVGSRSPPNLARKPAILSEAGRGG